MEIEQRLLAIGVVIYYAGDGVSKIEKIITNVWPDEYEDLLPKPDLEKLYKIEYNDSYIKIYLEDSSKSDAKDYLKLVKNQGFNKNSKSDSGKKYVRYTVNNDNDDMIKIIYYNTKDEIEITYTRSLLQEETY